MASGKEERSKSDMYIPYNENTKLYCYDVNSLYPYIMINMEMPTGIPISFEGNIRKYEPEAFGFFYCKINSPDNLEHPILQRRVKTEGGSSIRTIAGLGSWEGWVFSKKMDYCLTKGYTFEILRGYQFKSKIIFNDIINNLYELRISYDKSHPAGGVARRQLII